MRVTGERLPTRASTGPLRGGSPRRGSAWPGARPAAQAPARRCSRRRRAGGRLPSRPQQPADDGKVFLRATSSSTASGGTPSASLSIAEVRRPHSPGSRAVAIALQPLRGQMPAQIGLRHRRDRMPLMVGCRSMRWTAPPLPAAANRLPNSAVAAEVGLAADDRHAARWRHAAAARATAAPMLPTAGALSKVEQHLVVQHAARRARRRSAPAGSSSGCHRGRRHRARRAGDADRVERRRRRRSCRGVGHAAGTASRAGRAWAEVGQRVGGAGEIVAVPADTRRGAVMRRSFGLAEEVERARSSRRCVARARSASRPSAPPPRPARMLATPAAGPSGMGHDAAAGHEQQVGAARSPSRWPARCRPIGRTRTPAARGRRRRRAAASGSRAPTSIDLVILLRELALQAVHVHVVDAGQPPERLVGLERDAEQRVARQRAEAVAVAVEREIGVAAQRLRPPRSRTSSGSPSRRCRLRARPGRHGGASRRSRR